MTKNKGYVINMSNNFYVNEQHIKVIDFKDIPYYGVLRFHLEIL